MTKPRIIAARNYSQNASSYAKAASAMIVADDLDDGLKPAFYLLIGFCLELGLKSLCLSSGKEEKEIKGWDHDLWPPFFAAIAAGYLQDFYTDLHLLIETIGPMHKQLWFRYTPANVKVLHVPPPTKCVQPLVHMLQRADAAAWA